MMTMADLAIVTDAPALVAELARRLGWPRMPDFDAIVVGAGPAGSAAALVLARAGKQVCLLERGPFPGSKNMYGGVIYGRVLDTLIPRWWEQAPVQRVGHPAGNGDHDRDAVPHRRLPHHRVGRRPLQRRHHVPARLRLVAGRPGGRRRGPCWSPAPPPPACSATAVGSAACAPTVPTAISPPRSSSPATGELLPRQGGRPVPGRGAGELHPRRQGGARPAARRDREALRPHGNEGADFEIVGCTRGIPGGGFVYTNLESIAVAWS